MSQAETAELHHSARQVEDLARRLEKASAIALDVEGNGLFAYRTKLCTMQLAWMEGATLRIAIVDALAAPVAPLGPVLGKDGPLKILHDLAFDARILAESGVPLANAHDTTIFARFLGHEATGLARVLLRELGISLDKRLQLHDWSRRPLGVDEIEYLAGDVAHLIALHDKLRERAVEHDILEEVDVECRYRLDCAIASDDDPRPAYARLKHASMLGPSERALLRRLFDVREELARRADVPPYRILPNERILALSRSAPRDARELFRSTANDLPQPELWMGAVGSGLTDGDVPEPERRFFERRPVSAERAQKRRRLEGALTAWRRREAEARTVSEQVVLPGHCLASLVDLFLEPPDASAVDAAIDAISGIGARRAARYRAEWLGILEMVTTTEPAETPSK